MVVEVAVATPLVVLEVLVAAVPLVVLQEPMARMAQVVVAAALVIPDRLQVPVEVLVAALVL